ncbi:MAG: hypothetical protein JWN63_474 [Candidatus Acidoferrum typicum]|nr:hypothetical protein [Candidatus Acidoferrum typicum]
MYCPPCKAEYRQGFTRCADCDVGLVENYAEAFRHPLAKKVAVQDECGARLWHGTDPHFYVGLLSSLWNKMVSCYGVPEYPPIAGSATGLQTANSDPAELKFGFRKRTYLSQSGFSHLVRKNLRRSLLRSLGPA